MRRFFYLLGVVIILNSCATFFEQETQGITALIEESIMPSANIVVLLSHYYGKYSHWPADIQEIKQFAKINNLTSMLEKYAKLTFLVNNQGNFIVDYELKQEAIEAMSLETKELWGKLLLSPGRIEVYPPGLNGEIEAHYLDSSGSHMGNILLGE